MHRNLGGLYPPKFLLNRLQTANPPPVIMCRLEWVSGQNNFYSVSNFVLLSSSLIKRKKVSNQTRSKNSFQPVKIFFYSIIYTFFFFPLHSRSFKEQSIYGTYSGKDLKWLSRNSRIFNFVNLQNTAIPQPHFQPKDRLQTKFLQKE